MNFTYVSLDPVPVTKPGAHSARELRSHQGIPGIERSASGRLFAVWYAGGITECRENYVMMVVSDDNGATWSDAVAVIDPPHPDVRAFDPALWVAPDGRFFCFWAQGCGGENGEICDGIVGVWYTVLENPDDDPAVFRFTPPRRISNGIMMNKPTVLSDGTWALPCSVWTGDHYRKHESLGVVPGAMMVVSTDNGEHFEVRGRIDMSYVEGGAIFDEHMFVELRDGRIVCYIRVKKGIAESISCDGGRTWSLPELSRTVQGPNSRLFIRRLKSGRLLMVNNDSSVKREKMTAYLSDDDGATWPHRLLLDAREHDVAYPDGTEAPDGTLYLIHDFARKNGGYILMSRITEADILAGTPVSPDSALCLEVSHSIPVEVFLEKCRK